MKSGTNRCESDASSSSLKPDSEKVDCYLSQSPEMIGNDQSVPRFRLSALLVMPQTQDSLNYEDNSHDKKNCPAQPLGHWHLAWPGPTHEGRVKFSRGKTKYNGHNSDTDLKNPSSHSGFSLARTAGRVARVERFGIC
jgi:hypothetical protein